MQEAELRIGNWVHHDPTRWSNRNEAVNGLWNGLFQWEASDWYSVGECMLMLEDIEPIPLTEGILLKAGFSYNPDGFRCSEYEDSEVAFAKGEFCVSESGHKFFYWVMCEDHYYSEKGIEITSVHQLQNLYYALTGEELQITF